MGCSEGGPDKDGSFMKHKPVSDVIRRYVLFLIGLFIASMGVAFSTKAGLGTTPVASVPYSVSLVSTLLSLGGWLNLLSVIQIVIQIVILKGKCNHIQMPERFVLRFQYSYIFPSG